MNSPVSNINTGGYGLNDPYQYCEDNGLGPMEMHVIKYVTRHKRGRATGEKYGERDILAAIRTLSRILIDGYNTDYGVVVDVVIDTYKKRGIRIEEEAEPIVAAQAVEHEYLIIGPPSDPIIRMAPVVSL